LDATTAKIQDRRDVPRLRDWDTCCFAQTQCFLTYFPSPHSLFERFDCSYWGGAAVLGRDYQSLDLPLP
jgi:hypothetical protein